MSQGSVEAYVLIDLKISELNSIVIIVEQIWVDCKLLVHKKCTRLKINYNIHAYVFFFFLFSRMIETIVKNVSK